MNILAIPFNFLSFNGLAEANRKEIEKENVLGINVQNILGQIPIYNFFVGIGRIEKSIEHLKKFESSGSYLSESDKAEIKHARLHLARGIVELVPGAALIFLIPDIIFSIKGIVNYFKHKKEDLPSQFNEVNNIVDSLNRNYHKWQSETTSDKKRTQYKAEVKELIVNYIEKIQECETIVDELSEGWKKIHGDTLTNLKNKTKLNGKVIPTDRDSIEVYLNNLS